MLIVGFSDQESAEAWFAAEPYCKAGVYRSVSIKPYIDAMPII